MDSFPAPKTWGEVCGNRDLLVHFKVLLSARRGQLESLDACLVGFPFDLKRQARTYTARNSNERDIE